MRRLGKEIELTRFDSSETMASARRFNPRGRRLAGAGGEEKAAAVGEEKINMLAMSRSWALKKNEN